MGGVGSGPLNRQRKKPNNSKGSIGMKGVGAGSLHGEEEFKYLKCTITCKSMQSWESKET